MNLGLPDCDTFSSVSSFATDGNQRTTVYRKNVRTFYVYLKVNSQQFYPGSTSGVDDLSVRLANDLSWVHFSLPQASTRPGRTRARTRDVP